MREQSVLQCGERRLIADSSGALFWPEEALLVVADLHLEKGSSLARRGALLPPYDSRETLARLASVIERFAPERVISLGDGFHDQEASLRLCPEDRLRLLALTAGRRWIWLTGNHDPGTPEGLDGEVMAEVLIGGLVFRHVPTSGAAHGDARGEIAGHLHPKACIAARGSRVSRPCFVADSRRIILPAFGSYAGGLSLRDPALSSLFPEDYHAYLLGGRRLHKIARHQIERGAAAF